MLFYPHYFPLFVFFMSLSTNLSFCSLYLSTLFYDLLTRSSFFFVCLIVFQEDLCGHDRNIIETVDCQWEYNNSGDKYSMWLPKNHQFSLKENLRRIFCVVIDVSMCVCDIERQKKYNAMAKNKKLYFSPIWNRRKKSKRQDRI